MEDVSDGAKSSWSSELCALEIDSSQSPGTKSTRRRVVTWHIMHAEDDGGDEGGAHQA